MAPYCLLKSLRRTDHCSVCTLENSSLLFCLFLFPLPNKIPGNMTKHLLIWVNCLEVYSYNQVWWIHANLSELSATYAFHSAAGIMWCGNLTKAWKKAFEFDAEVLILFLFGICNWVKCFTSIPLHSPRCHKCNCSVVCSAGRWDKDTGAFFTAQLLMRDRTTRISFYFRKARECFYTMSAVTGESCCYCKKV